MKEEANIAKDLTEIGTAAIEPDIQSRILTVRGVQVILDWDIAELYGVETRVLNQAVKRNLARFPEKFRFQLTKDELGELITNCDKSGSKRHYPGTPAAFTEQGVAMLSAVLRSQTAIDISIRIMDAFVAMRHAFASMSSMLTRSERYPPRPLHHRRPEGDLLVRRIPERRRTPDLRRRKTRRGNDPRAFAVHSQRDK